MAGRRPPGDVLRISAEHPQRRPQRLAVGGDAAPEQRGHGERYHPGRDADDQDGSEVSLRDEHGMRRADDARCHGEHAGERDREQGGAQ